MSFCERGAEVTQRALQKHARQSQRCASKVASQDAEAIHQMRVASRRARAVLAEQEPFLRSDERKRSKQRARSITRLLGDARELDVTIALLTKFRPRVDESGRIAINHALRRLRAKRRALNDQTARAADMVRRENAKDLSKRFENAVTSNGACYRDHGAIRLTKRFNNVCQAYKTWTETGVEEDLHQVRIAFKKLRYACEIYVPLYGNKMKRFQKKLKDAQEHLGEWNDYRMAALLCEQSRAAANPKTAIAYPALIKSLEDERDRLLTEWRTDAAAFFAPSNQQAIRDFLANPTEPCCDHT